MDIKTVIIDLIQKNKNFTILTHTNPDPDTLCSACALAHTLTTAGKNAEIINDKPLSERMAAITEGFLIKQRAELTEALIISVDVASLKMLGGLEDIYRDRIDVCIDHHEGREEFAKTTYRVPTAAATGELVYELCTALSDCDKTSADMLYTAISADSGGFRYSNTTANTHRIAASLIEAGADAALLSNKLFESKTHNEIKALRLGYELIEFGYNGKLSYIFITQKDKDAVGLCDTDLDELPSVARAVDTVEIAVVIKQTDSDSKKFKISTRSKNNIDVCEFCAIFGGGGHKRAAGATLYADSVEDADRQIRSAIDSFLSDFYGDKYDK